MNKILKFIIYILLIVIIVSTYVYFTSFYNVTFIVDGKTTQKKVRKGDSLPKEIPIKAGYKFLYWIDDSTIVDNTYTLNYDAVLVAVFDKIIPVNTYTVTFDTDGGSNIESQIVNDGQLVVEPDAPTKIGYIFNEWIYNDESYDFNSVVNQNITLKASYVKENDKTYLVRFDTNGGSAISSKMVIENGQVRKPANPIKLGYIFTEWQLNGVKYDFNSNVTHDITLKAVYTIDNRKLYTISFDTKGGNKIPNQMVRLHDKAVRPINPEKEGYTFINWLYDSNIFDFSTNITKDITLEAAYIKTDLEADGNSYVVTFNSDGGTYIPLQLIENGNKIEKPIDPEKEGYTFIEWLYNGEKYDFDLPVSGAMTLRASYKKNETEIETEKPIVESKKYTITFDTNGGNVLPNQTVEEGNKVYKPSNPEKEGYIFKYWSFNGVEYDFNTNVTSNINLIAVYEKDETYVKTYTVTFNTDGGSKIDNQTLNEGEKISKPTNPEKECYIFSHWEYEGTEYNFNAPIKKDITLKAIYNVEPTTNESNDNE